MVPRRRLMEPRREKPAAFANKRIRATVGAARVSANSSTTMNQGPRNANRADTFGKDQTVLVPGGGHSKSKRKASVQLEPQQPANFATGSTSRPAMSPSAASVQTILGTELVPERNPPNTTAAALEFPQLLTELKTKVSAEWTKEAVDKIMRGTAERRSIAELPVTNVVHFKNDAIRSFTYQKLLAYLIQSRGTVNHEQCYRCVNEMGPFAGKECISMSGTGDPFLKGTCGACAWGGTYTACTWNVSHDVGKQPPLHRNKAIAAKNKVDTARIEHGLTPAEASVPQYFEAENIQLQYPGHMRLEDALARLEVAAQERDATVYEVVRIEIETPESTEEESE